MTAHPSTDGQFESIGRRLEAERESLAEDVVERQYRLQPELARRYGPRGRARCVQDTAYHLAYLQTAITFASPRLFVEYIAWAKPMMVAYGVSQEDVQRNLECLAEAIRHRLPEDMARVVLPYVELALRDFPSIPSTLDSHIPDQGPLAELAREYLRVLLRAERQQAVGMILDARRRGVSVDDIYLQIIQPCQREIGRLWQLKQITVAQEHLCTATTQLVMAQLYPFVLSQPRRGRRVVATSVSGELHEIGLRIVTDLFEANGWDTVYLGVNVPESSILRTLEDFRPSLLLVSATMAFHLGAVERLISRVRSSPAGMNVRIMVGGYPCNVDPGLWARLGADGYACDGPGALAEAERLIAEADPTAGAGTAPDSWTHGDGGCAQTFDPRPLEASQLDTMARLHSELHTTQRELARKHAELERINQQLVEADQSKDRFLATLAHEMRNPLTPIITGLELLKMSADDPETIQEVCGMMESQARHLERLVEDLMDISRITSGKTTLRRDAVRLSEIVDAAVDAVRPRIAEAGHTLSINLPTEPPRLYADETRLVQVLTNLLTNATRYTPAGGQIWLAIQIEDGGLVISVKDTGVGIPREKLEQIFEMFTQVDDASQAGQGGLGIGLMLVKRLTELHGGSVKAHSDGPGTGSEFVVRLPILMPADPLAAT